MEAPAIFPNSDIKYDVDKRRARQLAAKHKQAITWVPAKDTPTTQALHERPTMVLEKASWLRRHDRECGDLYGMLLLVKDMPVA